MDETEKNIESSEIILSYIFSFVDLFLIIACLYIFKSKNKFIISLKIKLLTLLAIDGVLLLINILIYNKLNTINNELFFSLIYSSQFLLIITSIEKIISHYKIKSEKEEEEKIDPYKLSIIFLFVICSYDKLFKTPHRSLYYFEYFITIKFLTKLYYYLSYSIYKIIDVLMNNKFRFFLAYLENTPFIFFNSILIYYSIKLVYILKIYGEFTNSIIRILMNILKISAKNYVFSSFIFLIFLLVNNLKEKEKINLDEENDIINTN